MNDGLPAFLSQQAVERISDVVIVPLTSGLFYSLRTGPYSLRSHGADFNLLLEPHVRQLLRDGRTGVYSLGRGLHENRESEILLVQVIAARSPFPDAFRNLLDAGRFTYVTGSRTFHGQTHDLFSVVLD